MDALLAAGASGAAVLVAAGVAGATLLLASAASGFAFLLASGGTLLLDSRASEAAVLLAAGVAGATLLLSTVRASRGTFLLADGVTAGAGATDAPGSPPGCPLGVATPSGRSALGCTRCRAVFRSAKCRILPCLGCAGRLSGTLFAQWLGRMARSIRAGVCIVPD
jgi:hypothetical protein